MKADSLLQGTLDWSYRVKHSNSGDCISGQSPYRSQDEQQSKYNSVETLPTHLSQD
jgi:hypothetical protein